MNKKIKEILDELYIMDSSLKDKEKQLEKIISKMLLVKPDVKIDENFKKQLRKKLLGKSSFSNEITNYSMKNTFKFFGIFLSGAVALSLFINIFPNILVQNDDNINLAFNPEIKKLSNINAFGKVQFDDSNGDSKGTGGGLEKTMTAVVQDSSTVDAKRMIMPIDGEFTYKVYEYNLKEGEVLPKVPENMYVYKRENNSLSVNSKDIQKIFNSDILDFKKFTNLGISYINMYDNKNEGYDINLDFKKGSININRNYDSWPKNNYETQKNLKMEDLPADDKIILVAENFISNYSIDLKGYSEMFVDNSWKKDYENSQDKQNYYVPDSINVVNQFILDDLGVYEMYGNPYGLNTSVSVRDMKVQSIGTIEKLKLIGSEYSLISNEKDIIDLAKKGNTSQNFLEDSNIKTEKVKVEIGNAKLVYFKKYSYNAEKNVSEEYFIPGLLFEVLTPNDSEKGIYPGNYISVPLVKDFLEDNNALIKPYLER